MEAQQFGQMLEQANSPDEATRCNAQKVLEDFKLALPSNFFQSCIYAVTNIGQLSDQARQMASLIFKNSVKMFQKELADQDQDNLQPTGWLTVEPEIRQQIKEALQNQLGQDEFANVKNASQCFAMIAYVEIRYPSMWDNFVDQMVNIANDQNMSLNHRHAALMTLGYVCEDLMQDGDWKMPNQMVTQILGACITNMSNSVEAVEISTIAVETLNRIIPSTIGCYEQQEHHEFIINQGILGGLQVPDPQVQVVSLNSLEELPYVAPFTVVTQYLEKIGQISLQVLEQEINSETTQQIKSCLKFWLGLCENEQKSQQDSTVVLQYVESLLAFVLKAITIEELEQDDQDIVQEAVEEQNETVAMVAAKLLETLVLVDSEGTQFKNFAKIEVFYMQQLQSTDSWLPVYTGINTIRAVLEGVQKANNRQFMFRNVLWPKIKETINGFFNLMQSNPVEKIRHACAKLVEQICSCDTAGMFLSDNEMMSVVFEQGSNTIKNETEKNEVKICIANAWAGLYIKNHQYLQDQYNYGSPEILIGGFKTVLQILYQLVTSPSMIISNKVPILIESMADICEKCEQSKVRQTLFDLLQTQLGFITQMMSMNPDDPNGPLQQYGLTDLDKMEVYINQYASLTQPLFFSIGQADKALETSQQSNEINRDYILSVMDLTFTIFQKFQKVCTGGLFIIHGMIVGEQLMKLLDESENDQDVIAKFSHMLTFLKTAMSDVNSTDDMGTRISCGIISDMCSFSPSLIIQNHSNLQLLIESCLHVLNDNDVEQQAKLHAVICLGDLYMSADGRNKQQDGADFVSSLQGPYGYSNFAGGQQQQNQDQRQDEASRKVFVQFLPKTLTCFETAAQLSVQLSPQMDDDDREVCSRLRESLVEGYLSVLHGLDSLDNLEESQKFKMQIVNYLEALCQMEQEKQFDFSEEMVWNMVDLYSDLSFILSNSPDTKYYLCTKEVLFSQIQQKIENIQTRQLSRQNNRVGEDPAATREQKLEIMRRVQHLLGEMSQEMAMIQQNPNFQNQAAPNAMFNQRNLMSN